METIPSKFRPFNIVTREDKKCVIVAGKYQVSPFEFDNVKDAEKYIKEQPFELILDLIAVIRYAEKENNTGKVVEENAQESV